MIGILIILTILSIVLISIDRKKEEGFREDSLENKIEKKSLEKEYLEEHDLNDR